MSAGTHRPDDHGAMHSWFETRPINLRSRQLQARALHSRLPLIGLAWATHPDGAPTGRKVKMLDYACGPGFMTKLFAPYVTSITGIDISPSSITYYTSNIPTFSIASENVSALVGDLLSDPPTPLADDLYDFDLITVGAALHHFPSPSSAVQKLAERLKPGGVLLVYDLWRVESGGHEGGEGRVPKGFGEEEMRGLMEGAGLRGFSIEVVPERFEIELMSLKVLRIECFVARAEKARG